MTSPPITGADLMDDQGLSAANRKLVAALDVFLHRASRTPKTRALSDEELNFLLDAARSESRSPPPGDVREEVWKPSRLDVFKVLADYGSHVRASDLAELDPVADAFVDEILALSALPIQGEGSEALGSVTPSASPSVVSRVSESGPATPSEDR